MLNRMLSGSLAILAALVLTAHGQATWYVATTGSDANTGASWASPFKTISNAVAQASAADTVLVSNGTYAVTATIAVSKDIAVQSVNGAAETHIAIGANIRGVYLNSASAVFEGFTLRGGNWAASTGPEGVGAYVQAGTLRHCVISNNTASASSHYQTGPKGGGLYMAGGTVEDCLIANNRARMTGLYGGNAFGGGAYVHAGVMRRCVVRNNQAYADRMFRSGGGGLVVNSGTVENCLIVGNETDGLDFSSGPWGLEGGGGVALIGASGVLRHCTVVGNRAAGAPGGGVRNDAGTVLNCIVADNVGGIPNMAGLATYSCAPELTFGEGNVHAPPAFVDVAGGDYRLAPGSPCIDAGTNITGVADDVAGGPRPLAAYGATAQADMGAYEYAAPTTGPLVCGFSASPRKALNGASAVFRAFVAGEAANTNAATFVWTFGDGSSIAGAGLWQVTKSYTVGTFDVTLVVTNTLGAAAACTVAQAVQVLATNVYLAQSAGNAPPYKDWAGASTDIRDAILIAAGAADLGASNATVWVSNGTYSVSGELRLDRAVRVKGLHGAASTHVRRGSGNTRVFNLSHGGAVLEGLTIRDGNYSFRASPGAQGGGIYMTAGTLRDCTISNNWLRAGVNDHWFYGGGLYASGGTIENCLLQDNRVHYYSSYCRGAGGGAYLAGTATMRGARVARNLVNCEGREIYGAGLYVNGANVRVESCQIYSNQLTKGGSFASLSGGGGIWLANGRVENCLVWGNQVDSEHSTAGNNYGGGGVRITSGNLVNCTIVGNYVSSANHPGGGVSRSNGTVKNCVIAGNQTLSTTTTNVSGTVTYCCSPDLSSGTGNIPGSPHFIRNGSGYGLAHMPGDYRLASGSPCIDTGDNSAVTTTLDLYDRPRLRNVVDMGAYEWHPPPGTRIYLR